MKLSTALVEQTLTQFEAQAIPEDHPVVPQLADVFGEHTFFLNGSGLHIVEAAEPAEEPESGPKSGPQSGIVIRLAAWTDDSRSSLAPHPPEQTGVVVPLRPEPESNGAA